ncbi:hypothetical protein FHW88_004300 [Mucilaginibacter sp. SG538B]|nr:hypothetical protein [Mucilaginibacter sp. SG538B]
MINIRAPICKQSIAFVLLSFATLKTQKSSIILSNLIKSSVYCLEPPSYYKLFNYTALKRVIVYNYFFECFRTELQRTGENRPIKLSHRYNGKDDELSFQ